MALIPGTRLGVYEITAQIGEGGMGQVYRATDTKLKRPVAIKILPPSVAADHDRLARFQREAEVLASLNHPNIAAIYGLEESGGVAALVMELVDGDDLSQRIARGPIRFDEAMPIAGQIVDALDAAHEQGIIHRDLKPANVKVRRDSTVKLLDFGLAKSDRGAGDDEGGGRANAPTLTSPAMQTSAGVILGTAAYMSPEQARGLALDRRTDIWAFGCVLYEMLSGVRAFPGATVTDTLVAILEREPDWRALPVETPAAVRRLLKRCLERDPKQRLRDIADARIELEATDSPRPVLVQSTSPRRPIVWIGATLLGLVLAFSAARFWPARETTPPGAISQLLLDVRPARGGLIGANVGERLPANLLRPSRTSIALSPDGSVIAFTARHDRPSQLYIRPLNRLDATVIAGTDGADGPFFSPDGRWIGFWANDAIRKVLVGGGPIIKICDTPIQPQGASWSADNRIVFAALTIWSVPASGGAATELTHLRADGSTEVRHLSPQVLVGGNWLLFTSLPRINGWDHARVVAQSLQTGQRKVLLDGAADARYAPTGHLVFLRLGTLMAARFDAERADVRGEETALIENVMQAVNSGNDTLDTGVGQFAFATNGTLIYVTGGIYPDAKASLQWIRRNGETETIPAPTRSYFGPRLSPDGRQLVVAVSDLGQRGLWRYDFGPGTLTRLTVDGTPVYPIWSPDGARVFFGLSLTGPYEIFSVAGDGSSPAPERVVSDGFAFNRYPGAWTPDGKGLVIYEMPGDIKLLSLDGTKTIRPVVATRFSERMPDLSPDGRWLAYVSDETGKNEVYVQSFPVAGAKRRVSRDGGVQPAWSRDGQKLVYLVKHASPEDNLVDVVEMKVTLGSTLTTGEAQTLFQTDGGGSLSMRAYDLTPDAARFLFAHSTPAVVSPPREIRVVQNWFEDLNRR